MNLTECAERFQFQGSIDSISEHKTGHINKTFVVECSASAKKLRYVLQRVNNQVFRDVPALMGNVEIVCNHIKKRLPPDSADRTLVLIPSKSNTNYIKDDQGEFWRAYEYVEGTMGYEVCPSVEVALEAGAALGRFQNYLFDLEPTKLVDTIPFFHDGRKRYDALQLAISADAVGRVKEAKGLIAFAKERRASLGLLVECLESGEIPKRATHNDMKLNNILFSEATGKGICIVDLDTCMSGTVLFDFGDLVRNLIVTAPEDEVNLDKIQLDMSQFKAVIEGYLGAFGKNLNSIEFDLLTAAPRILATTLGIRFLTDYLNGDKYFRVKHPQHNFERARAQFEVVSRMEDSEPEMLGIVRGLRV